MRARSFSSLLWILGGIVLFAIVAFFALMLIAHPGARLPPAHLTLALVDN